MDAAYSTLTARPGMTVGATPCAAACPPSVEAGVMSGAVTTIGLAGVNAYLGRAADGFVLVDTGKPEKRAAFEGRLERADWSLGMKPEPDRFSLGGQTT